MSLKQEYGSMFRELEELITETEGRLPLNQAILSVLISMDRRLKNIEEKP